MSTDLQELDGDVAIAAQEIADGRDVTASELRHTPQDYQRLVIGLLKWHATGEAFVLDHQSYAHWAGDAATSTDRFRVLRLIKEELEHAIEGWRLLRELGDLVDLTELSPISPRESRFEGFQYPTDTWAEFVVLVALGDRVGCFQQEEQVNCSYLPYAESIRNVYLPLERRHAQLGRVWLEALCAAPDGRRHLQAALADGWVRTLDLFGYSETGRQHLYIKYRLKERTNEERRQAFIATLRPELEALGLMVPDDLAGRHFT